MGTHIALSALLLTGAIGAVAQEAGMAGTPWVVEGRVAAEVWQHPLVTSRAGDAVYFTPDVGGQIVAYVRGERLPERGWVRLEGRELLLTAESKRPGDSRTFTVRQLDVERWDRLPGCDAVERLVVDLGREDLYPEGKEAIPSRILEHGRDAIPVLVAHLDDARVFQTGRAASGSPPLPRGAVLVGDLVRKLLLTLITPTARANGERVEETVTEVLVVPDWRAWWERHRGETLEQIRAGLVPLLEAHIASGGTPQVVE